MDKRVYLVLSFIGLILPYSQLFGFLFEYGYDLPLMLGQIVHYRISYFAWLDVFVTAIVLIVNIVEEDRVPNPWIPILGTLIIGPSFGLPIYLYMKT